MAENSERIILQIEGMTCTSCEMRIEKALGKLEGMVEVKAIFHSSKVYVTFDSERLSLDEIVKTIEKLDYQVVSEASESSHEDTKKESRGLAASSENAMSPGQVVGIGIILFALYLIIKNTVGFNFIPQVDPSMGYGILFVVGLLTSLHCIAMCGGINLSVCMNYPAKDGEPGFSKLKPSVLYNSGRIVSYTLIGGMVGALGSVVSFSGAAKGFIAILSGGLMVIMGLNMLNLFPWLRKLNPRMPKILGRKLHGKTGNKGPFVVGLLNGLMPCGPLQAMQLYALGTGSFAAGAISMFLFSAGTVPLMFGLGAVSSLFSGKLTRKMLKVSAVLVIVLGVVMLNRGLNLSGYDLALALGSSGGSGNIAKLENGKQVVTTTLQPGSYTPIVVQKGIPVQWTIKVDKKNLNGCNNAITSREFGIENQKLQVGETLIEFTPSKEGKFIYTCWMGMISSSIQVVSDISKVSDSDTKALESNDPVKDENSGIPTDEVAVAQMKDGVQYVSIDVNEDRFTPAIVVMQKGVETQWVMNGKQLNQHNRKIVFPEYGAGMSLKEGENKLEFMPEGDFTFLCEQGTLRGYVKVVEDLNNLDIESIKDEVKNYTPAWGGFGRNSGSGSSCH